MLSDKGKAALQNMNPLLSESWRDMESWMTEAGAEQVEHVLSVMRLDSPSLMCELTQDNELLSVFRDLASLALLECLSRRGQAALTAVAGQCAWLDELVAGAGRG